MKIFVSWSGEASRRAAEALRKYLPCMLQDVTPFMSKHDLATGARWSEQIATELDDSSFGIICLTPNNLQSPWILFEAGALTKHVDGRACCLLFQQLEPVDVSGPLAQFQNARFTPGEVKKLIADVNARLSKPLDALALDLVFEKWWPDLQRDIRVALDDPELNMPLTARRSERELLEELLLRMRSVEQHLQSVNEELPKVAEPFASDRVGGGRFTSSQISVLADVLTGSGAPLKVSRIQLEMTHERDAIDNLVALGFLLETADHAITVPETLAKQLSDLVSRTRW